MFSTKNNFKKVSEKAKKPPAFAEGF